MIAQHVLGLCSFNHRGMGGRGAQSSERAADLGSCWNRVTSPLASRNEDMFNGSEPCYEAHELGGFVCFPVRTRSWVLAGKAVKSRTAIKDRHGFFFFDSTVLSLLGELEVCQARRLHTHPSPSGLTHRHHSRWLIPGLTQRAARQSPTPFCLPRLLVFVRIRDDPMVLVASHGLTSPD